ncbi:hypothetical protein K438DRAFT_1969345 [Mycena galopus ATCC 62051]|nr:hypothetical protein K438DRAFT_1969345 [Mycena galopus ATCC 62051]
MKTFFTAFVALALASPSLATPATLATPAAKRLGPGKRGLCWPWYNSPLNPALLNDGQGTVNLIYDYETYAPPSDNGDGGLNFIGMQRCTDCDSSPIADLAARQQQLGFATLFTLNEPDQAQPPITPQAAAQWYLDHINPFTIKKSLPAVSSSTAAGQGLSWVQSMVEACAGACYYDYINIHWYGSSFAEFEAYVNQAHALFPNDLIVVTEFALQNPAGGQADQLAFFKQAFPFLDDASFVEMYFPFVATSPNLFVANDLAGSEFSGTGSTLYNNDGSISAVGQLLLSTP